MRPSKTRGIEHLPACRLFRPAADMDAGMDRDSVALGLDMLEAMRRVGIEGLSREDAARSMNVSSPTLCRMLGQGRRRIAPALRAGKTIPIEGGNIMYATERHGHTDTASDAAATGTAHATTRPPKRAAMRSGLQAWGMAMAGGTVAGTAAWADREAPGGRARHPRVGPAARAARHEPAHMGASGIFMHKNGPPANRRAVGASRRNAIRRARYCPSAW